MDTQYFEEKEKKKFHKLNLSISNQLDDSKQIVNSLIFLMGEPP